MRTCSTGIRTGGYIDHPELDCFINNLLLKSEQRKCLGAALAAAAKVEVGDGLAGGRRRGERAELLFAHAIASQSSTATVSPAS